MTSRRLAAAVVRTAVLAGLAGVVACASRETLTPLPTQPAWDAARRWLEALRASEPASPYGAVVRVTLREPRTGHTFAARGAVAVDPHHALRMILIGPGGATALDAWVTPERWRFAVPAAGILRHGGREDDPSLPIGFFRWWFLSPAGGRLLTSEALAGGELLVLRDHAATIDLRDEGHDASRVIRASRRSLDTTERIEVRGAALGVTGGERALYDAEPSGVRVEVVVETPSGPPDPEAFADPELAEAHEAGPVARVSAAAGTGTRGGP